MCKDNVCLLCRHLSLHVTLLTCHDMALGGPDAFWTVGHSGKAQAVQLTVNSSCSAAGLKVVCRYSSSCETLSIKALKSVIDPTAFKKLFSGNGIGKTDKGACIVARGLSGSPAPTTYILPTTTVL